MTERSLTTVDLVSLPKMKARELLALARAMVAIASTAKHLPAHVRSALDDVEAELPAMVAALGPTAKKAAVSVKAADRDEDNAVGALVDFVSAWARLPEAKYPEQVGVARACLEVLLDDGKLEYLALKPIVEHSEVQRRIDGLAERKLDVAIRKLGGGAFLDHLAETHAVYGPATGATENLAGGESAVVREASNNLAEALRTYVVRVVGLIDRKRPETRDLVTGLLKPLSSWTSSASNAANDDADDDPVTPPAPVPSPANDAAAPQRKVG